MFPLQTGNLLDFLRTNSVSGWINCYLIDSQVALLPESVINSSRHLIAYTFVCAHAQM